MKKIKSLFGAVALLAAIGLSAFSMAPTATLDEWFTINPSADPSLASSYTYYGSISPCSSNDHLCAIKGTRDASPLNNQPTQSSVNAASIASNNFANPVTNQVSFDIP
jgi:hypothetical protein